MTKDEAKLVIPVLKEGILYEMLLSDFERRFIIETALRYAEYGQKLNVTPKQLDIFTELRDKLGLLL